jgi:hypothetical protein
MKYHVKFQLARNGSSTLEKSIVDPHVAGYGGEYTPLPDVGDSVSYELDGGRKDYKVLSRHFSYQSGNWRHVNIVVAEL